MVQSLAISLSLPNLCFSQYFLNFTGFKRGFIKHLVQGCNHKASALVGIGRFPEICIQPDCMVLGFNNHPLMGIIFLFVDTLFPYIRKAKEEFQAMPSGLLNLMAEVLLISLEALHLGLASVRASCSPEVLPSFLDCQRDCVHSLSLVTQGTCLLLLSILGKSHSTSLPPYAYTSFCLPVYLLCCSPASLSFYVPSLFIQNLQDSGK